MSRLADPWRSNGHVAEPSPGVLVPPGNPAHAKGLPLPDLRNAADENASRYAVTSIDRDGRLADRSILTVLGWAAGVPVDLAIEHGPIVVAYRGRNAAVNPRVSCGSPWRCAASAESVPAIVYWSPRISDRKSCWSYR